MRLQNKIAIVTGGSRGIGNSTVRRFLEEGATVILCGSQKESADKAVAILKSSHPEYKVTGIYPDLTSFASVKKSFDEVIETHGKVDILVNNAGVSEDTPFVEYTEELFQSILDINLKGAFNCSRAVIDSMIAQKKGVILNTSSIAGKYGQSGGIAYPTSKSAINGFTLSLARELGPKGIRVNAVGPGITNTDMMKAVPEEMINPLISQIPLKRLGEPKDIADAFVFLASDEARYISGQILYVDGLART